MPSPTATIFVPYHALDEALPETVARTDAANTFMEDQTVNADLYVTGEINPARRLEQRPKIDQLIGPGAGRTLLSNDLSAGMSLRYDEGIGKGRLTTGNYDAQLYLPFVLEALQVSLSTGTTPVDLTEHLRVHPAGGVTIGAGTDHATDPGVGVVVARTAQFTAGLPSAQVRASAATRVLGRGASGPGAVQELTLGTGLVIEGTTLRSTAVNSSFQGYTFNSTLTPPPPSQTIRFNGAAPYTGVTKLWVSYYNLNNEDMYYPWTHLIVGSTVMVQDKESHLQYAEFTTTGPTIDRGTYAEVPVVWKANGTALTNNRDCLAHTSSPASGTLAALEARIAALEAR